MPRRRCRWTRATLLRALQAREQLGSTGLGKGSRCRMRGCRGCLGPFALFARLARPIDYASVDDKPVDLVVLLLTPESAAGQHLATLAALSRPFRDEGFVQQLRKAPDAAALYRVLTGG